MNRVVLRSGVSYTGAEWIRSTQANLFPPLARDLESRPEKMGSDFANCRAIQLHRLARFCVDFREFIHLSLTDIGRGLDRRHKEDLAVFEKMAARDDSTFISLDEAYEYARRYKIPLLMIDPLSARISNSPYLIGRFSKYFRQGRIQSTAPDDEVSRVPHNGNLCHYRFPTEQLSGTVISFVHLRLDAQEKLLGASDEHAHPGDELIYVLSGTAELCMGHSGVRTQLVQGAYAHFYAEQPHRLINASLDGSSCCVLIIRFRQMSPLGARHEAARRMKDLISPENVKTQLSTAEKWDLRRLIAPWMDVDDTCHPENERLVRDYVGLGHFLRECEKLYPKQFKRKALKQRANDLGFNEFSINVIQSLLAGKPRGKFQLKSSDLPKLAEILGIELPLFYTYLAPSIPDIVVVRPGEYWTIGQDDAHSATYRVPCRHLANSDTAIALLDLSAGQNGISLLNAHPGFELAFPVSGQIEVTFSPTPAQRLRLAAKGKSSSDDVQSTDVDRAEHNESKHDPWMPVRASARQGSYVHFRSDTPHQLKNVGKRNVQVLLVRFYRSDK